MLMTCTAGDSGLCKWIPSLRIQKYFANYGRLEIEIDWIYLWTFSLTFYTFIPPIDLTTEKDIVENNDVFIEILIHTGCWVIVIHALFSEKLVNRFVGLILYFGTLDMRYITWHFKLRSWNRVHVDFIPCCYLFNSSVTLSKSLNLSMPHYPQSLNRGKNNAYFVS